MRTQLLFALALMCGGGAASAQQPPASAPGYPGGAGAPTDTASSFSRYAAGSSRAADAAAKEDAKEAAKIQLTSGAMAPPPAAPVIAPLPGPVVEDAPLAAGGGYGGGPAGSIGWVSASGVVGWARAIHLPTPLATTSSVPPTERFAGALHLPGTSVLYGDKVNFDNYYGGQASAGLFLDDSGFWSGEVRGFYVQPSNVTFSAVSDSTGFPFITRPFFNLAESREAAVFDAKPGVASGGIDIKAATEVWGFEVNARANFGGGSGQGVTGSVLAGYRFLRLADRLTIRDHLVPLVPGQVSYKAVPIGPPDTLTDVDSFETSNNFNGFQVGGQVNWDQSWLVLSAYAKLAVGVTEQKATINGATTLVTPAGADVTPGGVLALSSNIGSHRTQVFGLIPEWGLTLGAALTQNLRVTVGYSFLLWNSVARPGNVIDRGLNPALIPTDASFGSGTGPDRPAARFAGGDNVFWLHAANAGIELIF